MLTALLVPCLLAADPALTVEPLGPAWPGGLLRVAVQGDPPPAAAGPVRLHAALREGEAVVAEADAILADPAQLAARSVLVLAPAAFGARALRLTATATWSGPGGQPRVLRTEVAVASPAATLAAAADTVAKLRAAGARDPLPWLWAEQIAELGAGGASAGAVARVAELGAAVQDWLAGRRPGQPTAGRNDLALRDPVDGSVQPWRLHLPSGAGPFPVAVLLPATEPGLGKARWPLRDAAAIAAAAAAGVAVVECYPAGDRAWDGAARRRLDLALAAAAAVAPLDAARGVVVAPVAVRDPPFPVQRTGARTDPAWWRAVLAPPLPAPPRPAGWADAPFVVVVGTAEHAAAVAANRRLAEAFRAAWAAHAHAVLDLVDDTVDPAVLVDRNLVLVGNPRSNRVLARLAPSLPFAWDHRVVTAPDGRTILRATGPSLACTARLPDGRSLLVLDGAPPPWGDGLPLAGQPDPLLLSAP